MAQLNSRQNARPSRCSPPDDPFDDGNIFQQQSRILAKQDEFLDKHSAWSQRQSGPLSYVNLPSQVLEGLEEFHARNSSVSQQRDTGTGSSRNGQTCSRERNPGENETGATPSTMADPSARRSRELGSRYRAVGKNAPSNVRSSGYLLGEPDEFVTRSNESQTGTSSHGIRNDAEAVGSGNEPAHPNGKQPMRPYPKGRPRNEAQATVAQSKESQSKGWINGTAPSASSGRRVEENEQVPDDEDSDDNDDDESVGTPLCSWPSSPNYDEQARAPFHALNAVFETQLPPDSPTQPNRHRPASKKPAAFTDFPSSNPGAEDELPIEPPVAYGQKPTIQKGTEPVSPTPPSAQVQVPSTVELSSSSTTSGEQVKSVAKQQQDSYPKTKEQKAKPQHVYCPLRIPPPPASKPLSLTKRASIRDRARLSIRNHPLEAVMSTASRPESSGTVPATVHRLSNHKFIMNPTAHLMESSAFDGPPIVEKTLSGWFDDNPRKTRRITAEASPTRTSIKETQHGLDGARSSPSLRSQPSPEPEHSTPQRQERRPSVRLPIIDSNPDEVSPTRSSIQETPQRLGDVPSSPDLRSQPRLDRQSSLLMQSSPVHSPMVSSSEASNQETPTRLENAHSLRDLGSQPSPQLGSSPMLHVWHSSVLRSPMVSSAKKSSQEASQHSKPAPASPALRSQPSPEQEHSPPTLQNGQSPPPHSPLNNKTTNPLRSSSPLFPQPFVTQIPLTTPAHTTESTNPPIVKDATPQTGPYHSYQQAYSTYGGSLEDFTKACVYIQILQQQKKLASYQYDDFIRAWWAGYVPHVEATSNASVPSAIHWYMENSEDLEFSGNVITKLNIHLLKEFYPREVDLVEKAMGLRNTRTETALAANPSKGKEKELLPSVNIQPANGTPRHLEKAVSPPAPAEPGKRKRPTLESAEASHPKRRYSTAVTAAVPTVEPERSKTSELTSSMPPTQRSRKSYFQDVPKQDDRDKAKKPKPASKTKSLAGFREFCKQRRASRKEGLTSSMLSQGSSVASSR